MKIIFDSMKYFVLIIRPAILCIHCIIKPFGNISRGDLPKR